MSISSNTIIHFTQSKEALEGILKNNFKIKYCTENLSLGGSPIKLAIPMVSFCDIPFSSLVEHMEKYGSYGIGMTREWAVRKKLNTVLYIEEDSHLATSYKTVYTEYLINPNIDRGKASYKEKCLADVIRYIKNYQGALVRNGKIIKEDYRFYNEREWRYLLDFNLTKDFLIPIKQYTTTEQKVKANEAIKDYRLEFTPNDIKYIIINNDIEISEFINILRSAKGKKYSLEEIEILMTRIITSKQIREDF